ncbi:MAG: hypothetical protein ABH836_04035 [Candidatus Omnitrophota bacterium]
MIRQAVPTNKNAAREETGRLEQIMSFNSIRVGEGHTLLANKEIVEVFDRTGEILEDFPGSFFDITKEREKIAARLKDLLAKNEHLRKKDFDQMMRCILSNQIEKEKEIGNLVNNYFKDQKDTMNFLSGNLAKIKEASKGGKGEKIREFQEEMNEVFIQQEAKKTHVSVKLKEFQAEQQKMRGRFLELLSKGRQLRIKDLKILLEEFDARRKERIAEHEERKTQTMIRRKTVHHMLNGFKKERTGGVKKCRKPKQG